MTDCPCCSGLAFASCCEPFLKGTVVPATAEQLMRARYTAYTRADISFLMATLHSSNRGEGDEEAARSWAEGSEWLGLKILGTEEGGAGDSEGRVEFIARFRNRKGESYAHHELSSFVKEDGHWLFKDGHTPESAPLRRAGPKIGRNDPCSCGSGKKYKKCCEKAQGALAAS